MVICPQTKVVYIGVPHTGCTFIHKHLNYRDLVRLKKHDTLSSAKKYMGSLNHYKIVMFIRKPEDYLLSEYCLLERVSEECQHHDTEWGRRCKSFVIKGLNPDEWVIRKLHKIGRQSIFDSYIDVEINSHNLYRLKYECFGRSCAFLFQLLKKPQPDISVRINQKYPHQFAHKFSADVLTRIRRQLKHDYFDYS